MEKVVNLAFQIADHVRTIQIAFNVKLILHCTIIEFVVLVAYKIVKAVNRLTLLPI